VYQVYVDSLGDNDKPPSAVGYSGFVAKHGGETPPAPLILIFVTRDHYLHKENVEYDRHENQERIVEAAAAGQLSVLDYLLSIGQGVDNPNRLGRTPLVAAVNAGQTIIAQFLLEHGADGTQLAPEGGMLVVAAKNGDSWMTRMLVSYVLHDFGHVVAAVEAAVVTNNMPVLRALRPALGIDQAIATFVLPTAIRKSGMYLLRYLIKELGANVDSYDTELGDHTTAFLFAVYMGREDVVVWLVKRGANILATTDAGKNAEAISKERFPDSCQTAYLTAKAHCSATGCSGMGLKKCVRCGTRYCGKKCQVVHWKAHKPHCKVRCANPICVRDTACILKQCTGCKRAHYCGQECQLVHRQSHKSSCHQNWIQNSI
jgi:hypothetical protein